MGSVIIEYILRYNKLDTLFLKFLKFNLAFLKFNLAFLKFNLALLKFNLAFITQYPAPAFGRPAP